VLSLHENKMISLAEIFSNTLYCIHVLGYGFKKIENILLFSGY
jgi:hypothetical protein